MALFYYWNFNRFQNPFSIYRENLMQLSKIGSKNTYHKCIKQLHEAKYIYYHPARSRFQIVRISIVRLDQEPGPKTKYQQLDLFTSTDNDTGTVPNTVRISTDSDTGTVSKMGHSYKPNNKKQNSVANTPTKIFEKNKEINEKMNSLAISNLGLEEVQEFFSQNNYHISEAHKFFYYNQGKSWMLNDKLPITDWKALAHKWMLNTKNKEKQMNITQTIQSLYDRYLQGEKINRFILPEFCDYLKLELTSSIRKEAIERRINQLSGSNENKEVQLWKAYMQEDYSNELLIKDEPNLTALAKRIAVSKHFQSLKSKGQQCIQ